MRIRDDTSIRNDCLSQGGAIDFASRQKARMRVNRRLGLKETVLGHYICEIQIGFVESADCSNVFPITLKNKCADMQVFDRLRDNMFSEIDKIVLLRLAEHVEF